MSPGKKKSNRDSKELLDTDVTGEVKRIIDTGGYGFILEDKTGRNVFFHMSAVAKDFRRGNNRIRFGHEVIYDLYLVPQGYMAKSVRFLADVESSYFDDTDRLYRGKEFGIGYARHKDENRGVDKRMRQTQREGRSGSGPHRGGRSGNHRGGSDERGNRWNDG